MEEETSLDRLPPDRRAVVQEVFAQGAQRRRLQELGFVPGAQVECVGTSPLGDPRAYQLRGDGNCHYDGGTPVRCGWRSFPIQESRSGDTSGISKALFRVHHRPGRKPKRGEKHRF